MRHETDREVLMPDRHTDNAPGRQKDSQTDRQVDPVAIKSNILLLLSQRGVDQSRERERGSERVRERRGNQRAERKKPYSRLSFPLCCTLYFNEIRNWKLLPPKKLKHLNREHTHRGKNSGWKRERDGECEKEGG
ncbi:KRAB domain-containing zinc finger protein [Sarotherodon galilaeus]